MIEIKTKLRRWGNSFGVVVPQRILESGFKEGDEIEVILRERKVNLRKMFGSHKFKKPVSHLMKETDKELYDD
jgi:antitoxin component of MazEF toxin-antitoxin module